MWCRMIWCLFGHLLFNVCIRHKICRVVIVFLVNLEWSIKIYSFSTPYDVYADGYCVRIRM